MQSEVLSRLTGPRVRAPVRPYVTESASSLGKWRHFPRIDYDVLFGKSLRWGMPRVQTALSVLCARRYRAGRYDEPSPVTPSSSECKMRPLQSRLYLEQCVLYVLTRASAE